MCMLSVARRKCLEGNRTSLVDEEIGRVACTLTTRLTPSLVGKVVETRGIHVR